MIIKIHKQGLNLNTFTYAIIAIFLPVFCFGADLPLDKENDLFFPVDDEIMLISKSLDPIVFGNLKNSDTSRLRKVEVSKLHKYGILENLKVQVASVDKDKEQHFTYSIGKYVYVLMFAKSPTEEMKEGEDYWVNFAIILNDNSKVHSIVEEHKKEFSPTGFGYVGKEYHFDAGIMEKISFQSLSLNATESIRKKLKSGAEEIKIGHIYDHELYQQKSKSNSYFYVLNLNNALYPIHNYNEDLYLGNWIQNSKILMSDGARQGQGCISLYVFSKENVKKIDPPCRK